MSLHIQKHFCHLLAQKNRECFTILSNEADLQADFLLPSVLHKSQRSSHLLLYQHIPFLADPGSSAFPCYNSVTCCIRFFLVPFLQIN